MKRKGGLKGDRAVEEVFGSCIRPFEMCHPHTKDREKPQTRFEKRNFQHLNGNRNYVLLLPPLWHEKALWRINSVLSNHLEWDTSYIHFPLFLLLLSKTNAAHFTDNWINIYLWLTSFLFLKNPPSGNMTRQRRFFGKKTSFKCALSSSSVLSRLSLPWLHARKASSQ